jgi:hypothetical protein
MAKKIQHKFFIEPRPSGFAVLRPGAKRASAIEPTQKAAEKRALEIDPEAGLDVSRVRRTGKGGPDQWRRK